MTADNLAHMAYMSLSCLYPMFLGLKVCRYLFLFYKSLPRWLLLWMPPRKLSEIHDEAQTACPKRNLNDDRMLQCSCSHSFQLPFVRPIPDLQKLEWNLGKMNSSIINNTELKSGE